YNAYYKKINLSSNLSILEQNLEKDRIIQLVGNNGSGKTFLLKKLSEIKGYIYIDHNFDSYLANDRFLDYLNNSNSDVIIFDEFDCRKLINRIDKNKKIIVVSHMETIGSRLDISEVV
ncbi:ATP-binding cassette domain-containing protein, partial [Photorhabdus sp. P32]|uniref:ATP-binding cassette domain-containing protein n=1 Tax=Photorhabdus sp. P32 TaxID=3117549 RepID=UPI00311ABC61